MGSIADLNARLGLIYKDFDKGLETVERKLRASGRRLSDLGDQLTVSISLPLAAAGAAAVKSAGDMEALQLALETQVGSAEAARKELELLRQEALKPGLGFEQAVKASVNLQAVGFSAEKARKITSEFGNALATAGKGAAELDGVVLALTQIQAKGVVSAEEINQIAERLPQIRTLMQQAFGTASSEAIQKLGISSQQFIEGITKELEKLPRATGGIKNDLENFFDAIKQGAAKFGFEISKAFDVPGKLKAMADGISTLADGFADLNPGVQSFILYAGAAFVAAGPLAKVLGSIKSTGAQAIDVFQSLAGGAKAVTSFTLETVQAFNALNLATRSFIVLGLVTTIAAAAYQLGAFNEELTANEKAQAAVNELNRQAASAIAAEKSAADLLIGTIQSEVSTREAKERALEKLKRISPEYFSQLKVENGLVNGLTVSYNAYIESLLKSARAAAAREKLVDIEKQLLDLEDQRANKLKEAQQAAALVGVTADQVAKRESENYNKRITELNATKQRLSEVVVSNEEFKKSVESTTPKTASYAGAMKSTAKATGEAKTELDLYLDKLKQQESLQNKIREAAASMGLAPLQSLPQVGTGPVQSNQPAQTPDFSSFATGLTTAITPAQAAIEALNSGMYTFNELFALMSENVTANGTLMQQAIVGASQAMQEAAASGESSFGALAGAAVSAAAKIVRAWIQQGVAAAVAKALGGLPFPFNIAAAAGAGALAAAAFNKVLGAIKVPGFAQGTKFAPGGLAIVGERGPELVNLPRGSQVTPNNQLQRAMGGDAGFILSHKIQGSDLVIVLERAQRNQARVRGF